MNRLILAATLASLSVAIASPLAAQTADGTISDTSKDATMEALGIDVMTTGSTDAERLAFFQAMSAEDQASMMEKCTTYIGREPTETANDIASDAAMSFCKVVVAPQ
jgi:hypothetical protein